MVTLCIIPQCGQPRRIPQPRAFANAIARLSAQTLVPMNLFARAHRNCSPGSSLFSCDRQSARRLRLARAAIAGRRILYYPHVHTI